MFVECFIIQAILLTDAQADTTMFFLQVVYG